MAVWIKGMALGMVLAGIVPLAHAAEREETDAVAAALACRQIVDSQARLACFEASMSGLEAAFPEAVLAPEERVVVQEEKKRRRLIDRFGFGGGAEPAPTKVEQVEAAPEALDAISLGVIETGTTRNGKLIVIMENGQVWRQIDSDPARVRVPRGDLTAEIKTGTFSSHSMRLNDGKWFKVRRVR
jgi:hypothetical protein